MRGKQSVKEGVWYIGRKRKYRKKKQRGKGFLIGLLASAAAPIPGEVAKPILKFFFGGTKRRRWEKNSASLTTCPSSSKSTQWYTFHVEARKNKWKTISREHLCVKNKNCWS